MRPSTAGLRRLRDTARHRVHPNDGRILKMRQRLVVMMQYSLRSWRPQRVSPKPVDSTGVAAGHAAAVRILVTCCQAPTCCGPAVVNEHRRSDSGELPAPRPYVEAPRASATAVPPPPVRKGKKRGEAVDAALRLKAPVEKPCRCAKTIPPVKPAEKPVAKPVEKAVKPEAKAGEKPLEKPKKKELESKTKKDKTIGGRRKARRRSRPRSPPRLWPKPIQNAGSPAADS